MFNTNPPPKSLLKVKVMQLYKSNFITQSNFNTCQKSCLSHCKALNSDYWTGFGFGWKTLTMKVHEWWMNMNEQIEFILSLKSLSLTICNECMYLHVFTGGLLWTICYQRWAFPPFLESKRNVLFLLFQTSPAVYEIFKFIHCCLAGKENALVKQAHSLDSDHVSLFLWNSFISLANV